jgi:hypothetical protein
MRYPYSLEAVVSMFGRRREQAGATGELSAAAAEYLLTGQVPAEAGEDARALRFDRDEAERLWLAHRAAILSAAKGRGVSPFALEVFEGAELPGLPAWGWHFADPRPLLVDRPVLPCPRCGSVDTLPASCLSRVRRSGRGGHG